MHTQHVQISSVLRSRGKKTGKLQPENRPAVSPFSAAFSGRDETIPFRPKHSPGHGSSGFYGEILQSAPPAPFSGKDVTRGCAKEFFCLPCGFCREIKLPTPVLSVSG